MSTPSGSNRSYGAQSAGATENTAQRNTFRRKLRYRFDNTLARGPIVLIGWLLVAAALLSIPFWAYLQLDPDGIDASGTSLLQTISLVPSGQFLVKVDSQAMVGKVVPLAF